MGISVQLEGISLLVTLILFLFHIDVQQRGNRRYQLFNGCLFLSFVTILLDIVSSLAINAAAQIPLWLNEGLSMAYFLAQNANFSLLTGYGFYLLNEHVSDRSCFRRAVTIIGTLGAALEVLVLFNPWTKWFFSFENNVYVRGPLNKLAFAVVGVELVMAVVCYYRHKRVVSRAIHRLMQALPPILCFLLFAQLLVPDILLVGIAASLVNLIFFISFQSNRIGQDPLTELPNRHTFYQGLSSRLRTGSRMHLIMVDLLHYEGVNRKYGTPHGDALLYLVARCLDWYAPQYQAFRFGNTRFLLMGTFTDWQDAESCAVSLREQFAAPWEEAGIQCTLEASFAHMITDTGAKDCNRVIEELEYTLSHARDAQNGSLVFFDERMREGYERKLYVLEQIRRALEEEAFEIYYQPVYSCEEGRFTTAESLLRLIDDRGRMISPAEFIPLAESNGLIDEISWMVLKKVCQYLGEHPAFPLESISINMSIQQLTDRTFLSRVHSCQAQYGVPAEKLRIEITERTITENPALVRAVMAQLTAEGIRFYLDDFGVGYSNLASMISLPFETVKMDASLLTDIEEDGRALDTLRLMVQMLHSAGFSVVAEGIERIGQVECVKALGVDRIQGYYYARPMPQRELEAFLAPKKLVLMKNMQAG